MCKLSRIVLYLLQQGIIWTDLYQTKTSSFPQGLLILPTGHRPFRLQELTANDFPDSKQSCEQTTTAAPRWEEFSQHILKGSTRNTVDGSEIPSRKPGMYKKVVVNHGISTTISTGERRSFCSSTSGVSTSINDPYVWYWLGLKEAFSMPLFCYGWYHGSIYFAKWCQPKLTNIAVQFT